MAVECEICKADGNNPNVFRTGRQTTALEFELFHDKGGNYHWHDPNIVTEWYRCDNHHIFKIVKNIRPCPSCIYEWMENKEDAEGI
jgi:hypothetical protein